MEKNNKNKILIIIIIIALGLFISAIIILKHNNQASKPLTKQEKKNLVTVKNIIHNKNYEIKTTKDEEDVYTYTVYNKNTLKYTITINNKTNKVQVSYTR